MPPAGAPRPDPATYEGVATALETRLDDAASATPHPGTLPLLHRLSRTEYQNAVRDLLAIEALPKEMDYSLLLPADNISSGFDNIADLLFVSPTAMERYLDAARKISRLAMGDPEMPPMVNIHRLHPERWQEARVDELPIGTRGGLAVRSYFPMDGDYVVKVDVANAGRDAHQIEITVDDERMQLTSVGGAGRGGRAAGRGAAAGAGRGAAAPLEFRIAVKAGPRLVGVTFLEQNQARDENTLRPRMRGRGTLPAISNVTISGPYNITGPGDTPSRRRILVCAPSSDADLDVPDEDSHDARRSGVPPSRHRRRHPAPAAVLRRRPIRRRIRTRHSKSDRTGIGEPAVSVPHRTGAGEAWRPARPIRSAISSSPPDCRFFSGAAFPTTNCWPRRRADS